VFPKKWLTALVSFALCGLVAMADEFRQTFVSGRSPRWFDVKLDMLGALVGIGIFMGVYFLLMEYKRMKNRIKQLEQELEGKTQ
jgi:VanZ family protein